MELYKQAIETFEKLCTNRYAYKLIINNIKTEKGIISYTRN